MYENLFKNPLHRVFVYGTLKRGEPNHRILQNTKDGGYAKFLGCGKTVNKYPLVIATKYNIPFLLKKPDTGNQILGEVYDVDTKMLEKLDELEEHPSFYVRTEEEVLMAPAANLKPNINFEEMGILCKAWTYFLPNFRPELLDKEMFKSYTNEGSHGLRYGESSGDFAKPEDVL
ncbi:putative gamma-glutamylcyclotransferase CG2811 isoform X2 [Venturia canescens]|uniref:putative gamma-glutamylcyclotransferase CG2811 isoform X2 n=1 Tax=Venturia canescens TaxID=32260 RepID=UPI001C9D3905|nr:putative gamma-glutamylcyclotransferase CG2811 isoform X2 [Venturia canescens]XP_043288575.1 putative gamma-glutamylcyclotransferase CG2811 isoform X2 [Venturia canescens]